MAGKIAFEDETLLVIDKPQGLPVTPGARPGLCDELFAARPALARVRGYKAGEGGLLNRLDNDTGGLVLFAKTDDGFRFYSEAMRAGRIRKTYLAVVHGRPGGESGVIDLALGHSRKSTRRMLAADGHRRIRGRGLPAHTAWKVLENKEPFSLLEVVITKGVRHQIRVHLAALECPVVGDKLYNRKGSASLVPCHLLCCFAIAFHTPPHPEINVRVPVPFRRTWRELAEVIR
jgi:23S rRNA-/tRNA-specific pseudouridylate synthase